MQELNGTLIAALRSCMRDSWDANEAAEALYSWLMPGYEFLQLERGDIMGATLLLVLLLLLR